MHRLFAVVAIVCGALSVVGCSDSGSPPPPPPPPPPSTGADVTGTVAGVDANGDGIRDDIARRIDAFNLNTEQRKATRQFAASVQSALIASATADTAYDNALKNWRAQLCMNEKLPNYRRYANEVQARTLNTEQRSRAWIAYEDKLGGRVFPEPTGAACD